LPEITKKEEVIIRNLKLRKVKKEKEKLKCFLIIIENKELNLNFKIFFGAKIYY